MLLQASVAGWLVVLAALASPPLVRPRAVAQPLPASAVVCVSAADVAQVDDVRNGRCPGASQRAPVDAWLRVDIEPQQPAALLRSSEAHTLKHGALDVYINQDAPYRLQASDPLSSRPYYHGRLSVPIPASTDQPTSLLVRLRIRDQRQVARPEQHVLLRTLDAARADDILHWLWQGMFCGVMLSLALYHAFLWRAERLAATAWYSLTLLAIALYFGTSQSLLAMLPFSWAPSLTLFLHPVVGPLIGIGSVQFMRRYTTWQGSSAVALKALLFTHVTAALIVLPIDRLHSSAAAGHIVNLVGVISTVVLVSVTLRRALRGERAMYVLVWSVGALASGVLVQIGSMMGVLPAHGWPTVAMQVGVTAQVIFLALGLSERIRQLRVDRDQAEEIVRLTLPNVIADRLKSGEKSIADRHEHVAVLFADLAGFTPLSASHEPEIIVKLLDALFSEMDALAHRVGAEKIKTIGDCYMVAAGAPSPHADPVGALADLALELPLAAARVLERVRARAPNLPAQLPLRVGLHVGPVVAGVLGKQKLAYDLWGDTVNTASRMESHGVIGRVQCTEQVVALLSDRYDFEARGEIHVRGKGSLPVWLLVGKKGTRSG